MTKKYASYADRQEELRLENLESFELHIFDDYLKALSETSLLPTCDILAALHFVCFNGLCYDLNFFESGSISFKKNILFMGRTPMEIAFEWFMENRASIEQMKKGANFAPESLEYRGQQLLETATVMAHEMMIKHI